MSGTVEFSIFSLFTQSDLMGKAVMLVLIFASIWSWSIIISKTSLLKKLKFKTAQFEKQFWSGGSLDTLYKSVGSQAQDPMSSIFSAAMKEWNRSSSIMKSSKKSSMSGANLRQRMDRMMQVTLEREMDKLENQMGFLASVGAVSPFIGLFGTVWGIMESFTAIGSVQNTSLPVIAPGIASALAATALGLIAAIPAVIFYNKLSTEINRYEMRLDNFTGEFENIISRQIDEDEHK